MSDLMSLSLITDQRTRTRSFALLLSFLKHLVRECQNRDMVLLALSRAVRETGASKEEMDLVHQAVLNEMKKGAHLYPEGFMP